VRAQAAPDGRGQSSSHREDPVLRVWGDSLNHYTAQGGAFRVREGWATSFLELLLHYYVYIYNNCIFIYKNIYLFIKQRDISKTVLHFSVFTFKKLTL
jgi:hypothetical protein